MIFIATIKDVAQAAGVSPATVSRVITNKGNTTSDTEARVRAAIQQLNYTPNASSLNTDRSFTFGFCLTKSLAELRGNTFYSDVLYGISQSAKDFDCNIQFSAFDSVEEQIAQCKKWIKQKKVDGFLITSLLSSDKDPLISALLEEEIPVVLIGRSLTHNILSIHNDNVRDSYMAHKYLIDKGYTNIVLLTDEAKQDVVSDRIHGYRIAMEEHGINTSSTPVLYTDGDGHHISETLKQAKRDGIEIDAIITMNSLMSLSVLNYCQNESIRVPDDLGIMCFNDAPYLDKISTPITSVDLNPFLIGSEAFYLLFNFVEGNSKQSVSRNVTLPSQIIERKSTNRYLDSKKG
ncbi:HTH-type transcriptional regulator MalR [compost metagenome]